ncbi:ABC transporter ATP-binding protein [Streptomyces sp. NPDC050560]|uniref:ABC transporter ATP-binding protein n=1 Tax=Streptomyces sp. NPDC050560 TaxID=3365630 RepID=UPI0037B23445
MAPPTRPPATETTAEIPGETTAPTDRPDTEPPGPTTEATPDPTAPAAHPGGVRVRGLTRAFDGRTVLDSVRLDIAPGEFVALLGPSGCGKSTLLRAVGGLDPTPPGVVDAPGPVATVFQEHRLLPWERVWRNVTLGLRGPGLRGRAVAALAEVGLAARADSWPATLSGGEAQRVALARALVRTPRLLLLDEPFGALDALTRIRARRLVAGLWEEHRPAVLMVTHDVEEALLLADRVLVIGDRAVAVGHTVDVPRPRALHHPGLVELRGLLLAALGVVPEEHPARPHGAAHTAAAAPPPSPKETAV